MTFEEFFQKYNNQPNVGNTPENKGECVGLSEIWLDNISGPHVWGNAGDLLKNADPSAYEIIQNDPTNTPLKGDVVVFNAAFNGTVGHTGIATGNADLNSFELFEQNDPLGSPCHLKTYNYNNVDGWFRLKVVTDPLALCQLRVNQLTTDGTRKDGIIQDRDNEIVQLKAQILDAVDTEKRLSDAVSKSELALQEAQNEKLTLSLSLNKQIQDLEKTVTQLNNIITDKSNDLVTANNKIAELQKKIDGWWENFTKWDCWKKFWEKFWKDLRG